jgi:hypothetical protein
MTFGIASITSQYFDNCNYDSEHYDTQHAKAPETYILLSVTI